MSVPLGNLGGSGDARSNNKKPANAADAGQVHKPSDVQLAEAAKIAAQTSDVASRTSATDVVNISPQPTQSIEAPIVNRAAGKFEHSEYGLSDLAKRNLAMLLA